MDGFMLVGLTATTTEEGESVMDGVEADPKADPKAHPQVNQLQGQLMDVLLQNQQLAEQRQVTDGQLESLMTQLHLERQRSRTLKDRLTQSSASTSHLAGSSLRRRTKNDLGHTLIKSKSLGALAEADSDIDVALEAVEDDECMDEFELPETYTLGLGPSIHTDRKAKKRNGSQWIERVQSWVELRYQELMDDFSEVTSEVQPVMEYEEEALNLWKLKNTLVRVGNVTDPLIDLFHESIGIIRWENPPISLVIFLVYMYIVWRGWLISFALLLMVFVFLLTYLRHSGWNVGPSHLRMSDPVEIERNVGVKDQIAIVLHVARRAQNVGGMVSDILEKIKNVLLWRQPELTSQVVGALCAALITSCIIPASKLLTLAGLYAGIHLFIIEYVFYRFPRVKQKYNKMSEIISQLATDAELEQMIRREQSKVKSEQVTIARSMSTSQTRRATSMRSLNNGGAITTSASTSTLVGEALTVASIPELFNLPATEIPYPPWQGGRRCVLVNKDRSLTAAFRMGRMYLTPNYLCFERFKSPNAKNIVVPLGKIVKLTKAKLYQWLPGGGRAIEIKTSDSSKSLVFVFQSQLFGAIVNRDEAFTLLHEAGRIAELTWATTESTSAS